MDKKQCEAFLKALECGDLRAIEFNGSQIRANVSVKTSILELFQAGKLTASDHPYEGFIDKDTLPLRAFNLKDQVRLVPGGSSVRKGAYIGPQVIIMPPSYVNIGAYVGAKSMIDSHVLVGSCAQIGNNVHLSAGVQIGGVLEPIGAMPVVIENDCFIGAGAMIVEGVHIKQGAVIAPGVVLSASVPIYDLVHQRVLPKGSAIPEQAVVIPGNRVIDTPFAQKHQLSMACPIIAKYKDAQTKSALALEQALR